MNTNIPAKKSYWKHYLSVFILIALSALYILVYRKRFPRLDDLKNIQLWAVIALALLALISILINGMKMNITYRALGVRLSTGEWIGLSSLNAFGNYIPLQGGVWIRGIYLKKIHNLAISQFMASVAFLMILNLGLLSIVAFIGTLIFNETQSLVIIKIRWMALIIMICVGIFLVILFLNHRLGIKKIPFLANVWKGFEFFRRKWQSLSVIPLLDAIIIIIWALRLYVSLSQFYALRVEAFARVIVMSSFMLMFGIIPLTPGNLAIREFIITFIASSTLVTQSAAISAALLDRTISFSVIVIAGILSQLLLYKKVSKIKISDSNLSK
jgi:uncharacterized membrane protein YbhN (UPF0104 family)